jgi:hypothetical protein
LYAIPLTAIAPRLGLVLRGRGAADSEPPPPRRGSLLPVTTALARGRRRVALRGGRVARLARRSAAVWGTVLVLGFLSGIWRGATR